MLGGKEFEFKNRSSLAFNLKIIVKGGNRVTPVDDETKYLEDKVKDYIRLDLSTTYRKNLNHISWELSLDVQNVTNRQNIYSYYWDETNDEKVFSYFPGLIPILNFRVVF